MLFVDNVFVLLAFLLVEPDDFPPNTIDEEQSQNVQYENQGGGRYEGQRQTQGEQQDAIHHVFQHIAGFFE